MNDPVWNRSTSNEPFFTPLAKRSIPSSALLLISVFSFVLFVAVGGYSVLEFRRTVRQAQQLHAIDLQRDSILLQSKDILDTMVSIFEKSQTALPRGESLQREFRRYQTLYSLMKAEYFSKSESVIDLSENGLSGEAQNYFSQGEQLIQQITAAFMAGSARGAIEMTGSSLPFRVQVVRLTSGDFQSLRLRTYQRALDRKILEYDLIRAHAIRYVLSSCVLVAITIILVVLMIRRENKISSGLKRYHTLLEHSMNPVHVTNGSGVTQYVNPAFLQWSGRDRSSLIGRNLFDMMNIVGGEKQTESLWALIIPVLSTGKAWSEDVEWMRPDGQLVVSHLLISPVQKSRGLISECIAFHADLTERKEFTRKIVETQRQYRSIVESSLDGIVVVQEGGIVYANPSAVRLFGYASAKEMETLEFMKTVAPPSRPFISMGYEGRTLGEEVLRNHELRGLTKNGKMIDLEANAHVVEWNSCPAVQASFRDITERKMLEREQALWLWEQETLSDIDRKLVGVVDLEKIFAAILQQTLNLTRSHFAGVLLFDETHTALQWKAIRGNTLQHVLEFFSPNDTLISMLNNVEPLVIHGTNTEAQAKIFQVPVIGEEQLVSTAWMPLTVEDSNRGMLVVGYRHYHDFAGREMRLLTSLAEKHSLAMVNAQLYADLLQREKELEILSGARVQAQEDERRRIAREIHDGLGQLLTAIKFNLEILEDTITVGQEERQRIDDMKGLLDNVMKEAREISYNLMPSVLEDFGLAPALQLLCEQFGSRSNVKVQYQTYSLNERFDPQLEIGLYRIVQESLNNVAKHAQATEISLQVIRHAGGLRLVIEDNGKGITIHPHIVRMTGKGGMGLVGMRERAASFGGTFTLDSTPNNGTMIVVEIPLLKADNL